MDWYYPKKSFSLSDRFVGILQALTPKNSTYKTTYRIVRQDGQILAAGFQAHLANPIEPQQLL
ncbi:hypothetical protein H6G74_16495 [Nostoc spongiaeforme FACHB-130]|uniref:Uncharacterized protein n=1 Tax=Nostoc spongiaeforme FACHB-130 TaxID=1357510 RepID=A0ABR8FZE9_9NOSO|nr:hypothetical protein [Nostoc spongiaeforme]MBD2595918.1 hypothetical protein [Nostoc spongiaeforme FACHB-130]